MSRVAVIQLTPNASLQGQLASVAHWLRVAADKGAKLVVLPENFALCGASSAEAKALATDALQADGQGEVVELLSNSAKQHQIWIVAGTLPHLDSEHQLKPTATTFVFSAQGVQVGRYDKIHLFDVNVEDAQRSYRESDSYQSGSRVEVVDTPVGRLGLSVCYDIRFPELYRQLRDKGAELIAVPSAFTAKTGEAHWELLLRARAVETQCYVLGANMGDRYAEKRPTWGGSAIVDDWGVVVDSMEAGEGVCIADIDLDRLHNNRQSMPLQAHRKL